MCYRSPCRVTVWCVLLRERGRGRRGRGNSPQTWVEAVRRLVVRGSRDAASGAAGVVGKNGRRGLVLLVKQSGESRVRLEQKRRVPGALARSQIDPCTCLPLGLPALWTLLLALVCIRPAAHTVQLVIRASIITPALCSQE
jgi:hypothetical protein